MLSILIPVYNSDIRLLVQALHRQGTRLGITFEIRCYDDGSQTAIRNLNQQLIGITHLIYRELPKNLGRSKIRNLLAKEARFPYLLFLDDDAQIIRDDFIKSYLDHLSPDKVLVGGRVYPEKPPPASQRLHWRYGKIREQRPTSAFQSNNFFLSKALFLSIQFNEEIQGYGHEDTFFGWRLAEAGISVLNIPNPVKNIGLDEVTDYLKKQSEAIENLTLLQSKYPDINTRLIRSIKIIKGLYLRLPFLWIFGECKSMIKEKLKSQPSLLLFDIYKIGLFLEKEAKLQKKA